MLKFLISFLCSVACVVILIEERKSVVYKTKREVRSFYNRTFLENFDFRQYNLTNEVDQRRFLSELQNLYADKTGHFKRLFCLPVQELFKNESELQIDGRLADQLASRLNRSFYDFLSSGATASGTVSSQTADWLALLNLTILPSIRSNKFYIFRDQICAIQEPFITEQLGKAFNRLQYYVLVEGFSELLRLNSADESAVIYAVLNDENTDRAVDHKVACLNECFRRKNRISKYFYDAASRGPVIIDYERGNRLIAAHERRCFKKCPHRCKLIVYEQHGHDSRLEMTTFQTIPSISTFSFWINFFGFCFAFFSVSGHKLLMKMAKILADQQKSKTTFLVLRTVFTFVCFVVLLLLSAKALLEYRK